MSFYGCQGFNNCPIVRDGRLYPCAYAAFADVFREHASLRGQAREFTINGKLGATKKIDDYTVAFEFPEPYPYFEYILAGSTSVGAGFATRGAFQTWGGGYAPGHYLKQFMPKYSSVDEVNAKAKSAGFDSWVSMLKNKYSWALNPEVPVMTPWKTVTPINTPTWSMERNPYYWAVDKDGNQLSVRRLLPQLQSHAPSVRQEHAAPRPGP